MNEYNFYGWQTADIRSAQGLTPHECYALLMQIWCAETCAPRMRAQWSEDNRTKGQCSITAFLMQALFGGEVYGIPLGDGNYHCFNRVGTCVFDLTSAQFGSKVLNYADGVPQSRDAHFAKEEKRQRYELLRYALLERIGAPDGAESKR